MTEKNHKKAKNYNLTVNLSVKRENGVTIEISTWCANWKTAQKFISDFENTLLKGKNGKS